MMDIRLQAVTLSRADRTFHFDTLIARGTITALAGASGSGKSTLMSLIAGFDRPQTGKILFDGVDRTTAHPSERPVSLVFQENNLFTHLDLGTNIALGIRPDLRLSNAEKAAVSEALNRTGLGGFETRMPGTLSGGERQRAAFARALVRKRPCLLLDEPFAALDPALRLDMGRLLLDLQRETGVTVLLVTHLPEDVERLAHHVIFLKDGEILADETSEAFLARQEPPEIRNFLGNQPSP